MLLRPLLSKAAARGPAKAPGKVAAGFPRQRWTFRRFAEAGGWASASQAACQSAAGVPAAAAAPSHQASSAGMTTPQGSMWVGLSSCTALLVNPIYTAQCLPFTYIISRLPPAAPPEILR